MQAVHDSKLLIDALPRPCFTGIVEKGLFSLSRKAKALDGLELPETCLLFRERRVMRNGFAVR